MWRVFANQHRNKRDFAVQEPGLCWLGWVRRSTHVEGPTGPVGGVNDEQVDRIDLVWGFGCRRQHFPREILFTVPEAGSRK